MNYYEELAVPPQASTEEIREAYRQLARLLHPDRSQDERSRRLAETQMKRLNAMVEVLTHPEKRQQYDAGLLRENPALVRMQYKVAPSRWRFRLLLDRLGDYRHPNNAWVVACSVVLLALFWAFRDNAAYSKKGVETLVSEEPEPPALVKERSRPSPQPAKALEYLEGQVYYWRRQSEQLRGERDAASVQVSRLENTVAELMSKAAAATAAPACAQHPQSAPPFEAKMIEPVRGPPVLPRSTRQSLAGAWHYVRPPVSGNPQENLYPPEFIEAVIVEEAGSLRGRYRARYRIPDRTISPNVVFEFSGKASAESATVPWAGPGGAKGEVRFRLLSDNQLEVAWTASELGAIQGLGSGSATLVRRVQP
jgi:curved DNA-binding protein CbpA